MATTIVSVLTGIPVRRDVAMTGEITLRGRVLPIGGLKEKLLAAARGGIKTVLIPTENAKDLAEIPANIREGLEIVPVARMDEVIKRALVRQPQPIVWEEDTSTPPAKEAGGAAGPDRPLILRSLDAKQSRRPRKGRRSVLAGAVRVWWAHGAAPRTCFRRRAWRLALPSRARLNRRTCRSCEGPSWRSGG
jgi:hypothetical protein